VKLQDAVVYEVGMISPTYSGVTMSVELSIIKGFSVGIEYVNGDDIGEDEVSVYVVFDLGFIRLLFTTYRPVV
jgi:hypothetical protein